MNTATYSDKRAALIIQLRSLRAMRNPPTGVYFLTSDVAVSDAAWESIKKIALSDLEERLRVLETEKHAA